MKERGRPSGIGCAALTLALTAACGDDDPPVGPATLSASDERRRPVRHLVDEWREVVRADSVLGALELEPRVLLDFSGARRVGEFAVLALPWPAVPGSLRVRDDRDFETRSSTDRVIVDELRLTAPHERTLRSSLAELQNEGGAAWLVRERRLEAEHLLQFSDQRSRLREHAILKEGERWDLVVDVLDRELTLKVRVRAYARATTRVRLLVDGVEHQVFEDIGEEWTTTRSTLSASPGTHRVSLIPELTGGEAKRGMLAMFDWVEVVNHAGDVVVVSESDGAGDLPAAGPEGLYAQYRPLDPEVVHALAPDPTDPEKLLGLLLGGPARLEERRDGRWSARAAMVDGTPGLRSFALDGAEEVRLVQPQAALLPFLHSPRMRLRDDSGYDTRSDGEVSAAIADRVLSRLECSHDRRAGWLLPPPGRLEIAASLRPEDRLRFAVGIADAEGDAGDRAVDPVPVEVAVRWSFDGTTDELWRGQIRAGGGWTEVSTAVEAGRTGDGHLLFETTGGDPDSTPAAAIADPRIVPRSPHREHPNLVLYLIDTLRADRLACYGNPNATSPTLDALAADGARFTSFYAVAAHTRPSTASALTGLHPRYHAATGMDRSLPLHKVTLAEILRDAGHSSWAFVANNQVAGRGIHFEQGFHRFVAPLAFLAEGSHRASSAAMNDLVLPQLADHGDEPFFLYLHSIDPHTPYAPPEELRDRFDPDYDGPFKDLELSNVKINQLLKTRQIQERDRRYLLAVYDAQIHYQDQQIGRLLEQLERHGLREDTVVAVFSDHGEEFGEHDQYYHGGRMWEELIHVPLIVHVPEKWRGPLSLGAPPATVDVRASHLDLVPTLLELLGVDAPTTWQGESLVPWMRGAPHADRGYLGQDREGIGAYVRGGRKLIWFDRRGKIEMKYGLFDLEADPDERRNLAAERADEVAAMVTAVEAAYRAFENAGFAPADPELVELDAEAQRQLEALGYLDPEKKDPPDEAKER